MAIDPKTLQAALTGYQTEHDRITRAIADIRARIKGVKAPVSSGLDHAAKAKPKRKISAAARKRMAAAQKKRWAEYHKAPSAGS
jgi:hypothetical protein